MISEIASEYVHRGLALETREARWDLALDTGLRDFRLANLKHRQLWIW
jgi:hypothetical protein